MAFLSSEARQKPSAKTIGTWDWLLNQFDRMSSSVSIATAGGVFAPVGRVEVLPPPELPLTLITWQEADGLSVTTDGHGWNSKVVLLAGKAELAYGLRRVCEAFCYKAFGLAVYLTYGKLIVVDTFGVDDKFDDAVPGYHFEDAALTNACVGHLKVVSPRPGLLEVHPRRYVGQWDEGIIEGLTEEYGSALVRSAIASDLDGINRRAHLVRGKK